MASADNFYPNKTCWSTRVSEGASSRGLVRVLRDLSAGPITAQRAFGASGMPASLCQAYKSMLSYWEIPDFEVQFTAGLMKRCLKGPSTAINLAYHA
eukprot:1141479-Pelagomonas_calceolata.AAC.6